MPVMITAPVGLTKPHAGVITTSPATAPEQNPRKLALPRKIFSIIPQTKATVAVVSGVVVKALAAITSAAAALPALEPDHPAQGTAVPTNFGNLAVGGI